MDKNFRTKDYVVNDYSNYALINFSKNEKDFERNGLIDCLNQLVFLKATFRELHEKHITFGNVRPYIDGTATYSLCDHINILKSSISSIMPLEKLERGKKYYLLGYVRKYGELNDRLGIELATNFDIFPIIRTDRLSQKYKSFVEEKCYKFPPDNWLRRKYKKPE